MSPHEPANAVTSLSLPTRRRRVISAQPLVCERPYASSTAIPWLIEPAIDGVDLVQWASTNRAHVDAALCEHGAILFRGFPVRSVDDFRRFVNGASDGLLNYTYRASPRAEVSEHVYTSTEYPADQSIFPHNEHAFSPVFPRKLFFYCETPATTGGETPIGSGRRIREAIPPETRDKFLERGVMYIRNYGDRMGLPWQTVFQTEQRDRVEDYCRMHGITCRWKPDGGLFTQQVGPAFVRHPVTGETLWFNHATFFHVTTLNPAIGQALLASYADHDLPNNTYYGDGSPIEPDVLDSLRAAYQQSMVTFEWQAGDVLILDNMLVVHARQPFSGPRRILVGMAEPTAVDTVKITTANT